jgi:DNA-binding beta-propeller fold protein YncE
LSLAFGFLAGAQEPRYPRINLAATYVVDPAWPKKPASMKWNAVSGVAVDAKDQVWVFTRTETPVQCYDAKGNFVCAWGHEIKSKAAHHIKIDHEGNVWIADIVDHVVQKYTPQGALLQTLGTKGVAGRDQSHFDKPTDMAITPAGDVFVSDGYGNNRVVHFDRDGRFVKEWGELGTRPGQFSLPHAIAVDAKGRLYVADRNNARVQVFEQSGRFVAEWRDLLVPWGLCVTRDNEIWVCGSSPMAWPRSGGFGTPPKDQVFLKFNGDGKLLQLVTVPKGADGLERPGECNWVHAIAADSQGNLYVGDILGRRVQKFLRQPPNG